ncbi:MAG: glycosyltransferase family 39 protein [Candidatus Omnitrophica bacterium]|nr:glycosyltransferase family 39 protein [Candidatus Omnitrophota bacterium]
MRLKSSLLKEHSGIIIILFLAVFLRMNWHHSYPPGWDPSVYILMGKYIFSHGQIGFIEPYRPLAWPLILGFGFKLGFSSISWGAMLEFLFGIGNIVLIYLIGFKVFDKKTGLVAALFLSFSPTHVCYGNSLYADIPAAFFGLLSVLLFIEAKIFLSGTLVILAFFTRFIYLLPAVILAGLVLLHPENNLNAKKLPPVAAFIGGVSFIAAMFLLFNLVLYNNILQPFIDAQKCYGQYHFKWSQGIIDCWQQLFAIESWFFVFVPVGIVALIQKPIYRSRILIALIGTVLFIWIGKYPTDIPRYLTASIPYLYLLAAYGFFIVYQTFIKTRLKYLLLLILLFSLGLQIWRIHQIQFPKNKLNVIQQYVVDHSDAIKDAWVSDPSAVVFSNLKIQELMYYPIVDVQKISDLNKHLSRAGYIFYDDRALPCRPVNDPTCNEAKAKLLERIKIDFELALPEEKSSFTNFGIFKRRVHQ